MKEQEKAESTDSESHQLKSRGITNIFILHQLNSHKNKRIKRYRILGKDTNINVRHINFAVDMKYKDYLFSPKSCTVYSDGTIKTRQANRGLRSKRISGYNLSLIHI